MNTPTSLAVEKTKSKLLPYVVLTIGIGLWGIAYSYLESLTRTLVNLLDLPNGPAKESIQFFVYDTPKVFMLLALIVFLMGIVRSYFSPERTRAILAGKNEGLGNIAAAGLGIVTPFCTCSAVPMFIGFLSAGVPLGVTFSFLIAAPMINEIALGLLFGLVGWKVAAAYLVFGLTIAIISGWIIGKLHLEHWLEPWIRSRSKSENAQTIATFADRIKAGTNAAKEIVGQVWLWVMAGIAIGALIHGYVPTELMATIMGKQAWWSVPAAVLIGVPLYSNHAGIIPVVEALLGKGAALGTVLAFMMSVTALSLPEAVILRKVLRPRLIAIFFGIVTTGILGVGYLFNALFS